MHKRLTALALCACLGVAAVSCSSGSPGPSESSATSSPSPTPSNSTSGPIAPSYAMTNESKLNLVGPGRSLPATGGQITIKPASAGATEIIATATSPVPSKPAKGPAKNRPATVPARINVDWIIYLVIGQNGGRALLGTVTVGNEIWTVLPNSGVIGSDVSPTTAHFWTTRAVTVNKGTHETNAPMTFVIKGTA